MIHRDRDSKENDATTHRIVALTTPDAASAIARWTDGVEYFRRQP